MSAFVEVMKGCTPKYQENLEASLAHVKQMVLSYQSESTMRVAQLEGALKALRKEVETLRRRLEDSICVHD